MPGPCSPTAPTSPRSVRGALQTQALLFVIGAGFFLWFLGRLRGFLLRAEGGTGRLSTVAFGVGVVSIVITVGALAFQIGLATAARDAGQPAVVGTMVALFTVANLPLAVMLTAVAARAVPSRFPQTASRPSCRGSKLSSPSLTGGHPDFRVQRKAPGSLPEASAPFVLNSL
jgi:hypothetical protein